MQWIVYTQMAILLLLFSPGVISIGTAYAAVAQLYVFIAVTKNDEHMITNAAQINTGVALGNIVLQFLVWRSTSNILNSAGAAFRTAVFVVVGLIMITTSEFLLRLPKLKEKVVKRAQLAKELASSGVLPAVLPGRVRQRIGRVHVE
jgi:hypothetical protein